LYLVSYLLHVHFSFQFHYPPPTNEKKDSDTNKSPAKQKVDTKVKVENKEKAKTPPPQVKQEGKQNETGKKNEHCFFLQTYVSLFIFHFHGVTFITIVLSTINFSRTFHLINNFGFFWFTSKTFEERSSRGGDAS
jgi:hypothetical protein